MASVPEFARIDFNPRSHERSDLASKYHNYFGMISIHAPTRGATADDVSLVC